MTQDRSMNKEQKNVDEIKGTTSGLTQMAVEGHE